MHAQDFLRSSDQPLSSSLKKSIIMATIDIQRHPSSFWTTRMDIRSPGDVDQDWHSLGPAEQNFHLEGLNHLNLAHPELQRMYATGASLRFKLVMTWVHQARPAGGEWPLA